MIGFNLLVENIDCYHILLPLVTQSPVQSYFLCVLYAAQSTYEYLKFCVQQLMNLLLNKFIQCGAKVGKKAFKCPA